MNYINTPTEIFTKSSFMLKVTTNNLTPLLNLNDLLQVELTSIENVNNLDVVVIANSSEISIIYMTEINNELVGLRPATKEIINLSDYMIFKIISITKQIDRLNLSQLYNDN